MVQDIPHHSPGLLVLGAIFGGSIEVMRR